MPRRLTFFAFPRLNGVLAHRGRSLAIVELGIEATSVANGVTVTVPSPQRRLLRLTIGTGDVRPHSPSSNNNEDLQLLALRTI